MSINTLPTFAPIDERYAELPLHVMDVETHRCVHCDTEPIWSSYMEYLEHFWTQEYEGEPGHEPDDEENFDYFAATCLATAA